MELVGLEDRNRLLQLARRALEAHVRREPPPPVEAGGALDAARGAFVTLLHLGELRGCLGRLDPEDSLAATIAHLAAVASDSDPRFSPVLAHELAEIHIEISVLTPERDVVSLEEIEVGRHGLIVEQGQCRGLLLPQVAIEYGWDRQTFLSHTCLKAGLPKDAWSRGARILAFEAQVFGEQL